MHFTINGLNWTLYFVNPRSSELVDRTGTLTVATTDPVHLRVYISRAISGLFLRKVIMHELGHCIMVSYGLLTDIHRMVKPIYWIEAEEWVCNFISTYSYRLIDLTNYILREMKL